MDIAGGSKERGEDANGDRKRWKHRVDLTQSNEQVCVTDTDVIPKPFAIRRGVRMHAAKDDAAQGVGVHSQSNEKNVSCAWQMEPLSACVAMTHVIVK